MFEYRLCPKFVRLASWVVFTLVSASSSISFCQQDQGRITGVVTDTTGAVVVGANILLTNTDQEFTLNAKTNKAGIYLFSPIKIGRYKIQVAAKGFASELQDNVVVDVQANVNLPFVLKLGSDNQVIEVDSSAPLLQTQDASVGQVFDANTIAETPMTQGNWVFMAQLANGIAPAANSRGLGSGDFNANGQRAEQNNFILDGVDNNVNLVDFLNGSSFVTLPPPEALAEFKIQTNSYSAEFGHSSGATLSATIKSGSNALHGSLSEQFRNDILDANDWGSLTKPEYRENLFNATVGFPIIRNRLFLFGDGQANRVVFGQTFNDTVPTALMRTGNFTELLSPSLTGSAQPIKLYQPNSGGTALLACNGVQNVFCPTQIDAVAQRILNLYPLPDVGQVGQAYSNYTTTIPSSSNVAQFDGRLDYNLSAKDQMFARFSYSNLRSSRTPPLGPILQGSGYGNDGTNTNLGENFAGSETHVFSPNLVNELRFGYNFLHSSYMEPNANTNIAAQLGFSGFPYTVGHGSIPYLSVSGLTAVGAPANMPVSEGENVYQILDNVTVSRGKHSLKMGVAFQAIRFSINSPTYGQGYLTYSGIYTSNLSAQYTGSGVADFLSDQAATSQVSATSPIHNARWYRSAYAQDDWRITPRMTLNLGVRYDYFQPYKAVGGYQANFIPTGPPGVGTGSALYELPSNQRSTPLAPSFMTALAANNITLTYVDNQALSTASELDFGPRVGVAYAFAPRGVIRAGVGMFYGGLESLGGVLLGYNYPFEYTNSFPQSTCAANNCPSVNQQYKISLETGYTQALGNGGMLNNVATPSINAEDANEKISYSINYNMELQQQLPGGLSFTLGYVGSVDRHLQVFLNPNNSTVLLNTNISTQSYLPFPKFGGVNDTTYTGISSYNSLQTKIEKKLQHGIQFLATYTWAHSLDDVQTPLDGQIYRNSNIVPERAEYSNSQWDLRNRVTFNGYYAIPLGTGFRYLSHHGPLSFALSNWSTDVQWTAQTGNPITITPNTSLAAGGSAHANVFMNPFSPNGTSDPEYGSYACPTRVRTTTHWFNPCSFRNPLLGTSIPKPSASVPASQSEISGYANAVQYLGGPARQTFGPGYERINLSLFKRFYVVKETYFLFRADLFNVLNTPAYANPSAGDGPAAGLISAAKSLQTFTPNARFAQFTAKFIF